MEKQDPLPPLNAIALSPDTQHIVVGGRCVFKIVTFLTNGEMKEVMNLRPGKQNMNYSVLDVEWHPTDKNLICTAPTNGAVCLWDCETKRKKLTHVLREHTRTVNKVSWHCEGHTFFTGSQDTTIKMWDIRDLGQSMATLVDKHNDGEVRFVECHYSNPHQLVTSLDTGVVQIWDIRYFVKPAFSINSAHQGVILAARWHPEAKDLIATGGRDGQIKIWDVSTTFNQPLAIINTPVGVGNLIWRPRTSQILSVGINSSFDLHLWSLSSPGVPLASIEKHTDVCKGICFVSNNIVVSCGMDGHVFRSDLMSDSIFPHKKLRMTTLCWNVNGDVATTAEKTKRKATQNSPPKFQSEKLRKKSLSYAQRAHTELSTPQISVKSLQDLPNVMIALGQIKKKAPRIMNIVNPVEEKREQSTNSEIYDSKIITYFAKNYKFQGDSIDALCSHNSKVAKDIKYIKISNIWEILKITHTQWVISKEENIKKIKAQKQNSSDDNLNKVTSQVALDLKFSSPNSVNLLNEIETFDSGFASKIDVMERQTGFEDFLDEDINTIIPLVSNSNEIIQSTQNELKPKTEQTLTLNPLETTPNLNWRNDSIVLDALSYQVDHGDVQTPVFAYLIFYEHLKDSIEESQALLWFHHYIEILRKLQLFVLSSHIIKYCPLERIRERSLNHTKHVLTCANCNKVLPTQQQQQQQQQQAWFCHKCAKIMVCSLCHKPMKGIISWCQGCGHGGHVEHMREWFSKNYKCATGCSHICQYKQMQLNTSSHSTPTSLIIPTSSISQQPLLSEISMDFQSTLLSSPKPEPPLPKTPPEPTNIPPIAITPNSSSSSSTPNISPSTTTPTTTPTPTPIPTTPTTPNPTPIQTPTPTPIQTPLQTPIQTPQPTPIQTPLQTPIITPRVSTSSLPRGSTSTSSTSTPTSTPNSTPTQTPSSTPTLTPRTPRSTPFPRTLSSTLLVPSSNLLSSSLLASPLKK